ncbi:MAG: Hsp20/alpha crystallin family protein [Myxococcota bacterium]|nr:Hsp20/alpha crystallin family protein [Myxococcota bacterium]
MLHNLMLARSFYGQKTKQNAATDIYDAGDHYLLQLEAVGFDKEDISLEVTSNSISIEGKKESLTPEGYTLKYGNRGSTNTFQRLFRFRETLDTENVQATMENGLLNITLPKRAARRIPITVQ